jgi:hypothetical protein
MKADTGVSRSPAISNGGFNALSNTDRPNTAKAHRQQKTHPGGHSGDGFSASREIRLVARN